MKKREPVTSKNLVARYYQIGESVTKFGTDQMRVLYKRIQIQDAQSDPTLMAEAIKILNDLDAKLTAAALGMHDSGLVRYLADNIDQDRLNRRTR